MDNVEARWLLERHLQLWRDLSYTELLSVRDTPLVTELAGAAGRRYQVEVEVFWDDRPGGALRVSGSVDDRGVRACAPLSDSFIVVPDGPFTGRQGPYLAPPSGGACASLSRSRRNEG